MADTEHYVRDDVRGFLAIAAGWFGQTAKTRSVSWAEFGSGTSAEFADSSWQHLSRSQYASIEKARTLLGYAPAFEPEAAALAARPLPRDCSSW